MTNEELESKIKEVMEHPNPLNLSLISAFALHDIGETANAQANMLRSATIELNDYYKKRSEK